jgi:hypothetical protein
MQYTEQQLQEFRSEFAKRRKRQWIALIPILAVFALFVTMDETTGTTPIGPVAVVLPLAFVIIIGVLAFSFTNWRCPACNKYLGKGISPKFCPKCGVQLQ